MKLIVTIDVPSLKSGARFYQKAFGWRIKYKFLGDCLELSGPSARICLLEKKPGSDANPGASKQKRTYRRHWTPVHLDIPVKNLNASLRKALRAGAKQEGKVQQDPYGKIAFLSDPFGHGFCLIQFQGLGYAGFSEKLS